MENYLENHVINFAHLLRQSGLNVGSSEIIDALYGLSLVDLTDRDQVYKALACLLIKSEGDQEVFRDAFAVYFAPLAEREGDVAAFQQRQDNVSTLREELTFLEAPLNLAQDYEDLYAALPAEYRQKILDFIAKTNEGHNVEMKHRKMLERNIEGALDFFRTRLSIDYVPMEATGDPEMDAFLYEVRRRQQEEALLFKDMAKIGDDEINEMITLVHKLARRLATRLGRRYRQSSRATMVDVRRSLRSSTNYGGVLLALKYRRQRVHKPVIVLLLDVSGSMVKYSRFVTLFMRGLAEVLPHIHVFAFAEHLTPLDLRYYQSEELGSLREVGEGTNLNISLAEFEENYGALLHKRTVLVVVSDAKTLAYREAAAKIAALRPRIKDILWLNPMEQWQWADVQNLQAFLPYVAMYEASSLDKLARALRRL